MTAPALNSPWIAFAQPSTQARLRLLCLPYAGGGAAIYRDWGRSAPAGLAIVPIELPGRGRRFVERPYTRLPELVAALAPAILPLTQQPFALFGHSMGALIAFELARELRRAGAAAPRHLFVSGHRAPQLPDPDRPIHALPYAEFVDELRQLNGTPAELLENAELMHLLEPTLRADFELCEQYAYTPGAPLDCPISAFGGLSDPHAARDQIEPWRAQTRGAFYARVLPGDHFFLHAERPALLGAIAQDLGQW